MAVSTLLVKSYASNIYMTGRNSFENIEATRPEYVTPDGGPVMAYAAKEYYIDDINRALDLGYITPQQHADTLALKGPNDKQYRPLTLAAEAPLQ
jgi:hypothetical protein